MDQTAAAPAVLTMTPAAAGRRLTVLAVGPVVTVLVLLAAAVEATFPDSYLTYGLWAAVLVWSPLPFSVPAVLLDHDRDLALAHLSGMARAAALVPWMLAYSPARLEMRVSVAAWLLVTAGVWSGALPGLLR